MKILAVKWRGLGDTVLWTAALDALRQYLPEAKVEIAFPLLYKDLFKGDPRFPQQHYLTSRWKWPGSHPRYDYLLCFHAGPRSLSWSLCHRAKKKVIHHHDRRGIHYFSDLLVPHLGKPMSAIERDINVVRALGFEGDSPAPKIRVSPELLEKTSLWIKKSQAPLIVLAPKASRPAKQWPESYYLHLIKNLSQNARVLVLVDPLNPPSSYFLFEAREYLISTPTLKEVMGILSLADLFVGTDSGIKHLACALGTKTLTLFGPESVGEWHGYDLERHPVLQKEVLCRDQDEGNFSWCAKTICPLGSHSCLNLIRPEEVSGRAMRCLESEVG